MLRRYLVLIFALFFVLDLSSESLIFKNQGTVIISHSLVNLIKKLPIQEVTIYEPHADQNRVYRGFDFQKLLSLVYQDLWKQTEEILFTCSDGYQPSIPVAKFKNYQAYLVYDNKRGPFRINNKFQNKFNVDLKP